MATGNIQKALSNFLINSPEFIAQNQVVRKAILGNILILTTNKKFKLTNEFKKLTSFNTDTSSGIIAFSDYHTMESELEKDEILDCALLTICNMLASYGGTIDKVRKLKSLNFSTFEILKLALDIIKKDSPWYVVASISLQVGTCLISELND